MSKLYWPSSTRLLVKLMPTFTDRGCHVVSMTYPYSRILNFLGRDVVQIINEKIQSKSLDMLIYLAALNPENHNKTFNRSH
jgi:hypothetical protein